MLAGYETLLVDNWATIQEININLENLKLLRRSELTMYMNNKIDN